MALFDKSKFSTKKEMYKFLIENKELLITQKKSVKKEAEGWAFSGSANYIINNKNAFKSNELIKSPSDDLGVIAVINTTNYFDGHEDVHIKGIWNKSMKETRNPMHVQEHKSNEFNKIIASGTDLNVYVKETTWKELGYNYDGELQALMHDSIVRKNRNPYMHDQYAKGYVTNHSVGMQYVKMLFAVNDKEYKEELSTFEEYIDLIVNKEDAISNGYFWAIKEARYLEGSAVPNGSNPLTPTLENNSQSQEPGNHSDKNNEPQKALNMNKLISLL